MKEDNNLKITLKLTQDIDGYPPFNSEYLWIKKIDSILYEIDNIPFYSREVSFKDVITIKKENNEIFLEKVINQSSNSIIRVIFFEDCLKSNPLLLEDFINSIKSFGCDLESDKNHNLVAISIPQKTNYKQVLDYLQDGVEKNFWDYEEAVIRH